jgi:hypothetical protein
MIKFFYVPPFAGSNFLAKHLLWDNTPPIGIGNNKSLQNYNANDNEYRIERDKLEKVSNHQHEMCFMFLVGKKDIFEEKTKSIADEDNVKSILEGFYQLPFWDFPMFIHQCMRLNDPWLTNFFKQCMILFIRTYKKENAKCYRIPDFEYGDYCSHLNMILDDKAKDLCAKLSRFKHIKSDSFHPGALQCDDTINSVPNTVDYSKLFFDLDEEELYKLFDFFDKALYFENNKDLIIEDFRNYTKKNFELVE